MMVSRAELIDSLIKLLDHFKSCQQCDRQVLCGILDPCLLGKLNRLENNNSTPDTICNGSDLARFIIQLTTLDKGHLPEVQSNGIIEHDGMMIETEREKDDESVSLISVSTTSDVADCDSSGVSSDPFSLLNIVTKFPNLTNHVSDREKTNSSELTETESVQESTFEMENSVKSDLDTTSVMSEKEGSVPSSTEECSTNSGDNRSVHSESTPSQPPLLIGRSALRDAFLQNKGSLEPKTPQNNSSLGPKTVQNNSSLESRALQNSSSLESRPLQNSSSLESRSLQNNSSLESRSRQNSSSFEPKTQSTSPGHTSGDKETVVYYRCAPANSSPCDSSLEAPVYKLVTTSDINSGKLLKKRVELQGTITRCYVVKSAKDLKLLNFTDSSGVTQATLRGTFSDQYDEMLAADLISVKGVCEKRCSGKTKSEKKLHHTGYEVVVESWSRVRDKENKPGNVPSSYRRADRRFSPSNEPRLRNTESRPRSNESRERNHGSRPRSNDSRERNNRHRPRSNERRERIEESRRTDYVRDEPRFGSTDIRYMDTEPRTNRDNGGERCRNVVNGEQGASAQRSSRNLVCSPPSLLAPVENRGPSGVSYSPTIFISDVTKYMNSNIVTWGALSDVTPSSATLHKSGTNVLLKFNAPYQVASSLVIVEGIPDRNKKNQTILNVERIEDLNQKHVACLKFLASPVREGCKSVKKISDLPKIINGSDIQEYFGKFVIMRAKLVDIQHGGKRGLSKGCVVCGDGVSINFSCLPFVTRNSEVNLGDQVVLIGKVDIVNRRSQQSDIPWITVDHIQVIPDKEADSILGFTKSAIYEALKQIVLDTLKNDDRASECDPWSFLKD